VPETAQHALRRVRAELDARARGLEHPEISDVAAVSVAAAHALLGRWGSARPANCTIAR
jgi:hypothetical protein